MSREKRTYGHSTFFLWLWTILPSLSSCWSREITLSRTTQFNTLPALPGQLPGDGPQESLTAFVEWVLVSNNSPLTPFYTDEELTSPISGAYIILQMESQGLPTRASNNVWIIKWRARVWRKAPATVPSLKGELWQDSEVFVDFYSDVPSLPSSSEISACPVMAKEAVYELSVCYFLPLCSCILPAPQLTLSPLSIVWFHCESASLHRHSGWRPLSPPPASESRTPPRPVNPKAPPWLLAPSSPPWTISPPASPGSLIPLALPWSVDDHPPPRDSTPPALPCHSFSLALSGFSLPPAPPWSFVIPAPLQPSGCPSAPWSPEPSAPPWPSGSSASPWLYGSPSSPWAPLPPAPSPSVGPWSHHHGSSLCRLHHWLTSWLRSGSHLAPPSV
ncbi:Streptococcal surface protein A [Labeo rohita]|uniref:Streptococcal surface protein A n=1 Tax=Labeo rohita TaxID=84645 RepID=A0ABQ8LQ85_LABRO|nr:Streptococcal surface protein A [Labeo rohita]